MFLFQYSEQSDLFEIIKIYESAAQYQSANGYNELPKHYWNITVPLFELKVKN